jgi:6-phosphogluconolactonase
MRVEEDSVRVIVVADAEEWAERAADQVASAAREAVAARGAFHVVVPGGSTPRLAFEALVAKIRREDPLWSMVHVYFGDERLVPPGHAESNYRMVREAWLEHISVPALQVHRIDGELDPEEACRRYSGVIGAVLRGGRSSGGSFDLVILGLGQDGHVASLVPGGELDFVADGLVGIGPAPLSPARVRRITLTAATLRSTREVVFWVRGREKAEAVRGALRGGMETMAPEVTPPDGRVTWILDQDAASGLTP